MDSQRFKNSCIPENTDILDDTLDRLKHAIWHRDWDDAAALATVVGQEPAPGQAGDLQKCLLALQETLTLAKASRLELFSELGRLQAIAGFSPPA